MAKEMKKLICITGCGASGTKAISIIMYRAGIQVGHERMGRDGMASWYVAVGKTKIPGIRRQVYFQDFPSPPLVLHQVRHPLHSISTTQRFSSDTWKWVCAHIKEMKQSDSKILRCMKYWLYWNERAERLAQWRYRIESLAEVWDELAELTQRPALVKHKRACLALNNGRLHTRKKKYRPVTWEQLEHIDAQLTEKIKSKGREYGYEI